MPSDREIMVRRNFEAYRDLIWIEELEPKFRERGMDNKQVQLFREAWNEHTEIKDWPWWQQETANTSNERLDDEIMDITDRLDQLAALRWLQERSQNYRDTFDRTLAESARRASPSDDKEIER